MKKIKKRFLALLMIICVIISSGCVKKEVDVKGDTLLSTDEYMKMRQDELKIKSIKKKDIKPKMIEWYDVDEEVSNKLWQQTLKLIDEYKINEGYTGTAGKTHEYLKMNIDNLVVSGNPQYKIATNEGYYYVNVIWKTTHQDKVAELNEISNYIGIRGAIGEDEDGNIIVDREYMKPLVEEVNAYREVNGKDPIDEDIQQIDMQQEAVVDTTYEATDSEVKKEDNRRKYRRLSYNSKEFNSVGTVKNAIPVIPPANVVLKVIDNQDLAGYSIYKEGEEISQVGHNDGEINIVFVFKHNLEEDTYDFYTMYLGDYTSNDKIEQKKTNIPDFIQRKLEILIERISKCYCNEDTVGLTCGELIYPQDLGIKLLLQRNATRINDHDLYIKDILIRDGNKYILDLEQLTTEQPNGVANSSARYLRKYYGLCDVIKNEFVLTDLYQYETRLLQMPEMDIDKGILKKMYAVGKGDIKLTEQTKQEVRDVLNHLAQGVTIKRGSDLRDDKEEIQIKNGQEIWGMYDRFNTDTTILSTENYETYKNEFLERATKYGISATKCKAYINVSEWQVGNDNQVEITTNECYDYGQDGTYVNRYVVLSNFHNKWVIDEMHILNEIDLTTGEVRGVLADMGIK